MDVIRVYAWLLDKVTDVGDGIGVVLGGRLLSHLDIGGTFGISWSGVKRATAYLVKVGLIAREQGANREYSYWVLHCRKFEDKKSDGSTVLKGKKYHPKTTTPATPALPPQTIEDTMPFIDKCKKENFIGPEKKFEFTDEGDEKEPFTLEDEVEDYQPRSRCDNCGRLCKDCRCYVDDPVEYEPTGDLDMELV